MTDQQTTLTKGQLWWDRDLKELWVLRQPQGSVGGGIAGDVWGWTALCVIGQQQEGTLLVDHLQLSLERRNDPLRWVLVEPEVIEQYLDVMVSAVQGIATVSKQITTWMQQIQEVVQQGEEEGDQT